MVAFLACFRLFYFSNSESKNELNSSQCIEGQHLLYVLCICSYLLYKCYASSRTSRNIHSLYLGQYTNFNLISFHCDYLFCNFKITISNWNEIT